MPGATAFAADLKLSRDNEVPPVKTTAAGSGKITVADDGSVSGSVKTTGIAATAAHIHVGAAGANGPVIVPLTKTADGEWSVPPGAKLSDEQMKRYKAGEQYVNVHSEAHKGRRTPRSARALAVGLGRCARIGRNEPARRICPQRHRRTCGNMRRCL